MATPAEPSPQRDAAGRGATGRPADPGGGSLTPEARAGQHLRIAAEPLCQDRWMPCPDGVRLASRLWIPAGEGPWPVLLMRQPYGRAIASTVTYAHPRWYAARGYLVVVQDVRGRGDSEGEFGGFAQEAADGAVAVRWCRGLPEANGRVGTYGFSYQGLTQLLNRDAPAEARDGGEAGRLADPLPDCLVPAMCGPDERLHWASEGGAHWWDLGLAWALQLAAEGCRRRGDRSGWWRIRRCLQSGSHLEEGLALLQELDPRGMGLEWLNRDPAAPEGWRRHALSDRLLRRPLLLIGGWHDPHLNGVLDLFGRSLAAGGRPQLCIGAWSHLDWGGGIDRLQLAFFRRHLGGEVATAVAQQEPPATAEPPPGLPTAGAGASSAATTAPADLPPRTLPAGAPNQPGTGPQADPEGDEASGDADPGAPPLSWLAPSPDNGPVLLQCPRSGRWCQELQADRQAEWGWQLASEGLAAIRSEEGRLLPLTAGEATSREADDRVTLVHDPWRPVPSRGGHLGPAPGLVERGDLDRRGDVACFQTAPLQRPLRLCGRPLLQLTVGADQPGFDLWAALSVVQSDGRVLQLGTGALRVLGRQALARQTRRLRLQPLTVSLAAGERLRLSLAAAAWPAMAVNAGDGGQPRGGSGPDHRIISLDLVLRASRLWLEPLLPPQIGAN